MPVIFSDYPRWIQHGGESVLVQSEDDEYELEHDGEKERMVKELEEDYGKKVDLRGHKGDTGLATLRAYYEAVKKNEPVNGGG